jgi:hypothetical protein
VFTLFASARPAAAVGKVDLQVSATGLGFAGSITRAAVSADGMLFVVGSQSELFVFNRGNGSATHGVSRYVGSAVGSRGEYPPGLCPFGIPSPASTETPHTQFESVELLLRSGNVSSVIQVAECKDALACDPPVFEANLESQ